MGRSIAAVFLGYALTGILVVVTDQIFARAIFNFQVTNNPPLYYFVISLITDTLYAAIGGWFCAVIARSQARAATIALIAGGEIIGVAAQASLWHVVPHWFGAGLVILFPPAVWFGSRLHARKRSL